MIRPWYLVPGAHRNVPVPDPGTFGFPLPARLWNKHTKQGQDVKQAIFEICKLVSMLESVDHN